MTEDVLGHDNGIIHQHANGEHQSHHGQHVQTESGEVQHAERDG